MKNLLWSLSVLAVAGLGSGCATPAALKAYPGAERPATQLAGVIVPVSVEVRSVNGAKLPSVTGMLRAREYTVATLPGAQDWSVRYYQPLAEGYYADPQTVTASPWTPLKFEATAGQTYRLHVETPRENPRLRNAPERVRFSIAAEKKIVSLPASVVGAPSPVAVPKSEAPQKFESATLQQLQNWWRAAGAQERQAFRDWIQAQP